MLKEVVVASAYLSNREGEPYRVTSDGVFTDYGKLLPIARQGIVISFPGSDLKIHFEDKDDARAFAVAVLTAIAESPWHPVVR